MDMATIRRLVMLTVGVSVFSCLFVLSYGYASHSPSPHRIRIDVVAPAGTAHRVGTELERLSPGGFEARQRPDEKGARRDIADTSAYGAVVLPASGPARVLTAGAAGPSVQQLVSRDLGQVARTAGRTVREVDLAPLPSGDRAGQSSYVYQFGLLIPSVIGSIGLYLFGRRLRLWFRVTAAVGFAVLASGLGVLVLDGVLGSLTGSPWTLWAAGASAATVFMLTMAAVHALLGMPGTAVGAGTLLVVGNAANGSSVPVPLLPEVYRQIAPWLPNGAAIRAFRNDVYFSGHGMGQPFLALALWTAGALTVLLLADLLHLRRRRHAPSEHARIHATPVVVHLLEGRAAGRPEVGV